MTDGKDSPAPEKTQEDATTSPRQFRRNVLANLAYFVIQTGLGIWFTPYLIRHLGVAGYGLVPMMAQLGGQMAIVTMALNGAVGRFLTVDLAREDRASANRTFNTSVLTSVAGAAIALPGVLALAHYAPNLFDVPAGHEFGAKLLLLCTLSTALVTMVGSGFATSTFALARFDIRAMVESTNLIVWRGLVVVLFVTGHPAVWHVGAGLLMAALVRQGGYVLSCRKLTPQLRLQRGAFDRARLYEMLGMSIWLAVDQVGAVLFLNVDLVMVNTLIGAEAGGYYAPSAQWAALLRTMVGIVAGVLVPAVIGMHARKDDEALARLTRRAVKLLGLGMAIPISVLCGFAKPLLTTWLGPDFTHIWPLMWLMVGPLAVTLAVRPLFSVNVATNKVRLPGIVTLCLGAGNVGLAIVLAKHVGWGVYGIAAAGVISIALKNVVFTTLYAAHLMKRPASEYMRALLPPAITVVSMTAAGYFISEAVDLTTWPRLAPAGVAMAAVGAALVWTIALGAEERATILNIVKGRKKGRS